MKGGREHRFRCRSGNSGASLILKSETLQPQGTERSNYDGCQRRDTGSHGLVWTEMTTMAEFSLQILKHHDITSDFDALD